MPIPENVTANWRVFSDEVSSLGRIDISAAQTTAYLSGSHSTAQSWGGNIHAGYLATVLACVSGVVKVLRLGAAVPEDPQSVQLQLLTIADRFYVHPVRFNLFRSLQHKIISLP
jgi:hypothetical protein